MKRVMVVVSNARHAGRIASELGRAGFVTSTALTHAAALKRLDTFRPDMVILQLLGGHRPPAEFADILRVATGQQQRTHNAAFLIGIVPYIVKCDADAAAFFGVDALVPDSAAPLEIRKALIEILDMRSALGGR